MEEKKCWTDSKGNPHLDKNDCIKTELELLLQDNCDNAHSVVDLLIRNKDEFLDFLNAYDNKKAKSYNLGEMGDVIAGSTKKVMETIKKGNMPI